MVSPRPRAQGWGCRQTKQDLVSSRPPEALGAEKTNHVTRSVLLGFQRTQKGIMDGLGSKWP
jgi:hypothetical protein